MLGGDGVEEVRHSTAVQLAQAVRDRRIGPRESQRAPSHPDEGTNTTQRGRLQQQTAPLGCVL